MYIFFKHQIIINIAQKEKFHMDNILKIITVFILLNIKNALFKTNKILFSSKKKLNFFFIVI